MNKKRTRTWLLLLTLPAAFGLHADPDGETIVMQGNGRGTTACVACHGVDGAGNASAGYPYLAGLPTAYLTRQLQAFKDGSRQNAVMEPIASNLNEAEMAAVATYFSGQKNTKPGGAATPTGKGVDKGAELARNGKWEAGVPACFQCHGSKGQGVAPHFPPLVGQPYRYLRDQLLAWQKGQRNNDPMGLMQSVTQPLSADDIDAVARYLAIPAKQ